jgi:hypothetical protein
MDTAEELKSTDVPLQVNLNKRISRLEYHEKLNVLFAGSDDELFVLDPTLGEVLYRTSKAGIWDFFVGAEKIVLINEGKVGIRSEYNGIFLLDSILQTPIQDSSEHVEIELNKAEVNCVVANITKYGLYLGTLIYEITKIHN